jgi:homoserine dehydrogenase
VVIITNQVKESDVDQAIQTLEAMDAIDGKIMRIRVGALD